MVPCIFNLSELKEFGQAITEKDKMIFVSKFTDCVKMLLLSRCLQTDFVADSMGGFELPPQPIDLKFDFALLKETMDFEPDFDLLQMLSAELVLIENCRARIEKFDKKGWWYRFNHCRYRNFLRNHLQDIDKQITFQDIFSVAVAYFVQQGWGGGSELKQLMVY